MPIIRDRPTSSDPRFSIGLNIILQGSKSMTPDQQDRAMKSDYVHVLIHDSEDESCILLDVQLPAEEFKTGSVGYKYHEKGLKFYVR